MWFAWLLWEYNIVLNTYVGKVVVVNWKMGCVGLPGQIEKDPFSSALVCHKHENK